MATTNYEVRDDFGQPQPPAERRNWWATCLIGCLAMVGVALVLGVLAAVWISNNWRGFFAKGAVAAIEEGVNSSELPAEEKVEVMVEVKRAADAFTEGSMSKEQATSLMAKFVNSPLMITLGAAALEKNYIDQSGLSEEEREAARVTLRRFMRGSIDGDIDRQAIDNALRHVAEKQPDGTWTLRKKVSDEDLRAFLAEAKKTADEAKVPEQPVKVDPSDEVKRIIDETLSGPAAAPQMPAAQPDRPAQ